jgi:hypothetical protein
MSDSPYLREEGMLSAIAMVRSEITQDHEGFDAVVRGLNGSEAVSTLLGLTHLASMYLLDVHSDPEGEFVLSDPPPAVVAASLDSLDFFRESVLEAMQ